MSQIQFIQVTPGELTEMISSMVAEKLQVILNNQAPQTKEKEYLSREETAEILLISLSGLHKWCREGILNVHKVGKKSYFKRTEVLKVLDGLHAA